MKSIFKKIALVLALAMVVTMLPAKSVSVSAADASTNKWTRKTCTLYVDSPVVGDKDGIYVSSAYATAKTKVADPEGWKTEGYTVSFTSADETIATVGAKYGLVEAVGIGMTTITATYSKAGAADVVESFPVTVKRSAIDVALDEETAKAVDELVVGADPIALKAVMTDADGNSEVVENTADNGGKLSELLSEGRKFVTDYLKYDVKNPEGKDVIKVEDNKLTAVAEGDATLVVKAYRYDWQSWGKTKSKYVKVVTVQKEIPVTVKVAGLLDAKQTTHNTVAITCETEELAKAIADKPAENLKVTYELNQGEIAERINYAVVDSTDKKVVKVTLYNDFVKDTTYNFTYADSKVSVVGADLSVVADLQVVTQFVKFGDYQTIEVWLLNADGIVIREVKDGADLAFSAEPSIDYSLAGNVIFFFEAGKQATITVTYDTGYDLSTGTKKDDIVRNAVIVSRNEDSTYGNVVAWGVAAGDGEKGSDIAKSTDTLRLAVGDSKYLYIRVDETQFNGTVVGKYFPSNDPNEQLTAAYIFESSNPDILIVDSITGKIDALNSGYVQILVRKVDYASNPVVGLIGVQVSEARQMTSVVLKSQDSILSAINGQTATVKFEVKDQLGDSMAYQNGCMIVENVDGLEFTYSYQSWDGLWVITAKVTDATKFSTSATNVNLKITISDPNATWRSQTRVIRVTVKQPGEVARYVISGGIGQTDLNLVWAWKDEASYSGTFTLSGLDSQGYFKETLTLKTVLSDCVKDDYYVEVFRNNVKVPLNDDPWSNPLVVAENKGVKISLVTVEETVTLTPSAVTSSAITKRSATGVYIIRAYRVGDNKALTPIATTQFNVVDNTPSLSVVRNTNGLVGTTFEFAVDENDDITKEAVASALQSAEAFKVYRSGSDITGNLTFVKATFRRVNNALYISTITVKESGPYDGLGVGATLEYDINVNLTFTLN